MISYVSLFSQGATTRYVTRHRMRYRIIIDNFYNIQHMGIFSPISDVLLFMLLYISKG